MLLNLPSQILTFTNSARLLIADPICLIHLDRIFIVTFMNAEIFSMFTKSEHRKLSQTNAIMI